MCSGLGRGGQCGGGHASAGCSAKCATARASARPCMQGQDMPRKPAHRGCRRRRARCGSGAPPAPAGSRGSSGPASACPSPLRHQEGSEPHAQQGSLNIRASHQGGWSGGRKGGWRGQRRRPRDPAAPDPEQCRAPAQHAQGSTAWPLTPTREGLGLHQRRQQVRPDHRVVLKHKRVLRACGRRKMVRAGDSREAGGNRAWKAGSAGQPRHARCMHAAAAQRQRLAPGLAQLQRSALEPASRGAAPDSPLRRMCWYSCRWLM